MLEGFFMHTIKAIYDGINFKPMQPIPVKENYFMHTIKAIYDGTNFKAIQPIPVKEEYEVFITFIEPLKKDTSKTKREAMFGCLRGKYKIADDFDAPIDDFKEYME
jgi:predicted DNA-binding antitoxin AbrB/MazE fold protein